MQQPAFNERVASGSPDSQTGEIRQPLDTQTTNRDDIRPKRSTGDDRM